MWWEVNGLHPALDERLQTVTVPLKRLCPMQAKLMPKSLWHSGRLNNRLTLAITTHACKLHGYQLLISCNVWCLTEIWDPSLRPGLELASDSLTENIWVCLCLTLLVCVSQMCESTQSAACVGDVCGGLLHDGELPPGCRVRVQCRDHSGG